MSRAEVLSSPAAEMTASRLEDYWALTKPRVVALIAITTAVGYLVGSPLRPDWWGLILTMVGTALAGGGALALNQVLEWPFDAKMDRTRRRPVAAGRMEPRDGLVFGVLLVAIGLPILTLAVDPLAGMVTAVTVALYLFAYTPLKRRSALCTLVGAFPGALPPVTGWAAATGDLGAGALALFGVMFFWQLPHSLAIARLYRDDYAEAGFKLLPVVDRDGPSTRRQVLVHSIAMVGAGLLPTLVGIAGIVYGASAALLGVAFLILAVVYAARETTANARLLFLASLLYMPLLLATLALDRIPR